MAEEPLPAVTTHRVFVCVIVRHPHDQASGTGPRSPCRRTGPPHLLPWAVRRPLGRKYEVTQADVGRGIDGWLDDIAMCRCRSWGFERVALTVPIYIAHGHRDQNMPTQASEKLAAPSPSGDSVLPRRRPRHRPGASRSCHPAMVGEPPLGESRAAEPESTADGRPRAYL